MALQQSSVVLSRQVNLCPSPLHITKDTQRKSLHRQRLLQSSSSRADCGSISGPLDDIIDEISTNIWRAPLEVSPKEIEFGLGYASEALLTWLYPLKAPSTCIVTALPVSRIPSDRPLTVRKCRNSRSTDSSSSSSFTMHKFKNLSKAKTSPTDDTPEVPNPRSTERPKKTGSFFSGLKRLGHSSSSDNSRTAATAKFPGGELDENVNEGTNATMIAVYQALETFMDTKPNSGRNTKELEGRAAEHLQACRSWSDPAKYPQAATNVGHMPPLVSPVLNVVSDTTLLDEDKPQDVHVVVDIIGNAHNLRLLSDPTISVVIVIDTAYYVSKECLASALDTVDTARGCLSRGDRFALFTTHCTHETVTDTVPDMIWPLRPSIQVTKDIWKCLSDHIRSNGTQKLLPARPNPKMTDVIEAVVKCVRSENIDYSRTHVFVLTPAVHKLHNISKTFPKLSVYLLNPAPLPYRRSSDLLDPICDKECCDNVTVIGWAHQEHPFARMTQCIKYAKSEEPVGSVHDLSVTAMYGPGVECIAHEGSLNLPRLKLGQVSRFSLHLRVKRPYTQELDYANATCYTQSNMDASGLNKKLQHGRAVSARHAHICNFNIVYKLSLLPSASWVYQEQPLTLWTRLGGLPLPDDTMGECEARRAFRSFNETGRFDAPYALRRAVRMNLKIPEGLPQALNRMQNAALWNSSMRQYESTERGTAPLVRTGPVDIRPEHDFLRAFWDHKKLWRRGVALEGLPSR